jgi:hypothetical protein
VPLISQEKPTPKIDVGQSPEIILVARWRPTLPDSAMREGDPRHEVRTFEYDASLVTSMEVVFRV